MADLNTNCPKCSNEIAYDAQLAGQLAQCPHCGGTISLPKRTLPLPWILVSVLGLIIVCLAGVLIAEHHSTNKDAHLHQDQRQALPDTVQSVQAPETRRHDSGLDQVDRDAIESLCKHFYDYLNQQNMENIHAALCEPCQRALNVNDLKMSFSGNASYQFIALNSVKLQNSTLGLSALATVARRVQTPLGQQEGTRNLILVKNVTGWRLLGDHELEDKIVRQFSGSLTAEINNEIQILRDGDPFDTWGNDSTNSLRVIFQLHDTQSHIFPWDLAFKLEGNKIDGYNLILNYSLVNKSSDAWKSPFLQFDLKSNGSVILSANDTMPDLLPNRKLLRSVSFFLASEPQETIQYALDVYYPVGFPERQIFLAENLPMVFKVQKVSELARIDIISTQFDLATSEDSQEMLCARLNYRVKNIGREPIKALDIRCVWESLSGEQIDQSTDYVVGYGDVPLGVGQFKAGFIRCNKGYTNARVPVKVDVYLESGEKRELIYRGLQIR